MRPSARADREGDRTRHQRAGALHRTGRQVAVATLKLTSWQGFTGQAGHSYDVFDWGTAEGAFDTIDAAGLLLAINTRLDTSRLYLDGTISIAAVSEPGEWVMLLAGLALAGARARKRGCDLKAHGNIGRTKLGRVPS